MINESLCCPICKTIHDKEEGSYYVQVMSDNGWHCAKQQGYEAKFVYNSPKEYIKADAPKILEDDLWVINVRDQYTDGE